jgi:transposase
MPKHKSSDYKLTAVQYYLVKDKTQEEVCKIFKCSLRSLMRLVDKYKKSTYLNLFLFFIKDFKILKFL